MWYIPHVFYGFFQERGGYVRRPVCPPADTPEGPGRKAGAGDSGNVAILTRMAVPFQVNRGAAIVYKRHSGPCI